MRSVVLIRALLKGMGHETPCEMLAMRESTAGSPQVIFSRCSVIDAPQELPDGDYAVSFDDYSVPARKEGGLWMPADGNAIPTAQLAEEEQQRLFRLGGEAGVFAMLKGPRGRVA
jgi:hypothetical protein